MRILVIVVITFLALFGFYGCNKRNGFIDLRENYKSQWQQVENQYQRRLDLIPNIVASVQGQADFEKSTLEAVINARASATQVKLDVNNLDEASIQKYKQVQGELSSALSRLLVVSENYPNLQANQGFSELRTQLEGTENRISNERMKYNEAVKQYNVAIQKVPGSFFSWGFAPATYFESEAGAEKAPGVKFDFKSK
ncbi:MAG: LemA family protein [Bacteroidia bacterium]